MTVDEFEVFLRKHMVSSSLTEAGIQTGIGDLMATIDNGACQMIFADACKDYNLSKGLAMLALFGAMAVKVIVFEREKRNGPAIWN